MIFNPLASAIYAKIAPIIVGVELRLVTMVSIPFSLDS
jgi:hypothetical protein